MHWQDHCCSLGKQGIPMLLEGAMWTEKLLLGWHSIGMPMVPSVPVLGKDITFIQCISLQLP